MIEKNLEKTTYSFSEKIKKFIESEAQRVSNHNPFFNSISTGSLNKYQFLTYLANLEYIFKETPLHLEKGIESAKKLDLHHLVQFFKEKMTEELGHDQWARNDINQFEKETNHLQITSESQSLMNAVHTIASNDPQLYIAYMVFVEYFTILVAPQMIENLDVKCNIQKNQITAIANHEEADKHHTDDDLKIIEEMNLTPSRQLQFLNALEEFSNLVEKCFSSFLVTTH